MDGKTQQGSDRLEKEAETLALDLNEIEASSLFLILKYFISDFDNRIKAIENDSDLSEEGRTNAKEIEHSLMEEAEELLGEVKKIVIELEKPKNSKIILPKPKW